MYFPDIHINQYRFPSVHMINTHHATYYVTTTRFNDKTYDENKHFRDKISEKLKTPYQGCVYGSPTIMTETIPLYSNIIVIEMLNIARNTIATADQHIDYPGKIMGISLLKNNPQYKKYRIYKEDHYNRYTYVGKVRIDRKDIQDKEKLKELENILFLGKSHLKRGHGFTSIPQTKLKSANLMEFLLTELSISPNRI